MLNWFKSFFAHPKTSAAGLGALVGAAAIGYGMSTGAVPINAQTIATTGGLASAGLAGLSGKDAVPSPQIAAAASIAAPVVDFVQQYQAMQAEANTAQDKIVAFEAMKQSLAQALPVPSVPSAVPVAQ